jgi:hypothetical protein
MPIVRAEALQNTESGPVALLGNGPSLKLWPLDRLSCPAIGINLSYRWLRSKYHCFVTGGMVEGLITGKLKGALVFHPSRYLQRYYKFPKSFHQNQLVAIPELVKQKEFCWDLDRGSDATFGGIFAIQVALFLGFTELYLLGYDEHNKEGHFQLLPPLPFSGAQAEAPEREETHLPWYPLVKCAIDNLGIKVFVCNRESAIRIWPFADPPLKENTKWNSRRLV